METKIEKKNTPIFRTIREVIFDAISRSSKVVLLLGLTSFLVGLVPYLSRGSEALLLNRIVDFKVGQTSELLLFIGLLGLTYYLFDALLEAQKNVEKKTWFSLVHEYETVFAEKIVSLDMATHEDSAFQDKMQAVAEEGGPYSVAGFVELTAYQFQNIAGIITASWIMIATDWRIFVAIAAASVPMLVVDMKFGDTLWSLYQGKAEDRRKYNEIKRHTSGTTSIRELVTFQTTKYFLRKQKEMLSNFFAAQLKEERKRFFLALAANFLMVVAITFSVATVALRAARGDIQIGMFTFTLAAIVGLANSLAGFMFQLAQMYKKIHIVRAFFDILAMEPRIAKNTRPKKLRLNKAPTIEFKNVSFHYPSKPDKMVLQNVNFKIESGERVALVGENGSGKSTIIKLLFRFYDPTEGEILVDGVDLKDVDQEEWYGYLALLAQDFSTYRFPVWELIRLGRLSQGRDQTKIERAAIRANAARFINEWEHKYDQQLGVEFAGGVEPSQGQKQKLAIARSLYRDAFITILDEPTAAVDALAEKEIFESLEKETRKEQTLILVSHRFSTVRKADKICVIDDGTIKELGSHDELLKLGGMYTKLFTSQAEGYK